MLPQTSCSSCRASSSDHPHSKVPPHRAQVNSLAIGCPRIVGMLRRHVRLEVWEVLMAARADTLGDAVLEFGQLPLSCPALTLAHLGPVLPPGGACFGRFQLPAKALHLGIGEYLAVPVRAVER